MDYKEAYGNINTEPYRKAAERFLPDKIKVLFIFESPPFPPPLDPITKKENPDWSYFYRFETKGSNNLRREVSTAVFNKKITDHKYFLNEFCKEGYFLIDAVSYPINKITKENEHNVKLTSKGDVNNKEEREKIICSEAYDLNETISYWIDKSDSSLYEIKILLIKVSVFNGLMLCDNPFKEKVKSGTYNLLNRNEIPFPMVPNNKKFINKVRELLKLEF